MIQRIEDRAGEAGFWVLGFTTDVVVETWQDVRLAESIERIWLSQQRPADFRVLSVASADEYAFRWYVSDPVARALDQAGARWRDFIVDRVALPPASAKQFIPHG